MKKLYAVLCGVLAFVIFVCAFTSAIGMDKKFYNNKAAFRDLRTYERYQSTKVNKLIIEKNTLPIFGSSELVSLSDYNKNIGSFLNGDEMNILTLGAGYFQTLLHSMTLGALSDSFEQKKIALFLSPQWFDADGNEAGAFASRISEEELLDFLSNDKISNENKQYVLNRTISLLQDSPTQLAHVEHYKNAFEHTFSLDFLYAKIMKSFWQYKNEFSVFRQFKECTFDLPYYDLSDINYSDMMELAQKQGEAACTNNSFGVNNKYWDTYVAEPFSHGEVLKKEQANTQSPEYEDLKHFLNIAKELDIQVILFSIPVNAYWYNFKGSLFDTYYENIRNIVSQYDNISFYDFSCYEKELYFFKDIMHLGWKGWTRINEALYKEFVEK